LGVAAFVATLAACEETINSLQEKQDLSEALASSGALESAGAGSFGAVGVLLVPNVGQLTAGTAAAVNASLRGLQAATYEGAIGIQIIHTTTGAGSATFTGVVAWDGFDNSRSPATVDEVVVSGGMTETTTPVANGSHTIGGDNPGFAAYSNRTNTSDYIGTSGAFNLTSATFGGSDVNCATYFGQGEVTSCMYRTGTMTGSFNFGADRISGSGPTTYAQSAVNFTSIPAVRITIVE
jgi:hypothetical protein